MPLLPAAITELTNHIFDPIMNQVLNRFIYQLGYKHIFEDRIYVKTNYSAPSDTSDGDNNAMLRNSKFTADATIQMQPDGVKWPTFTFNHTAAYGVNTNSIRNQALIFMDRNAKISMWEQASPCSIMMACKMHFLNKMHAYQTPHMISNMFINGSVLVSTDLFYDYQIPGDLARVLTTLHQLKDIDLNFLQYVQAASSGIIGVDVNNHGDRPELVVKKTQIHCLYSVEYTDEQPSTDETGTAPNEFVIPFTYTLQFNIPNLLFLEYPIVIDNKLVPGHCININTVDHPPALDGGMPFKSMNDYYEQYKRHPTACFVNPFYEDWIVPSDSMPRKSTQDPFYIGTLIIDNPDIPMVIDLTGDIGDGCVLAPETQDILIAQGDGSFKYDAIFNITIYKDNYILDQTEMHLSDDLKLSFFARDKRFIYRLVISQIRDVFKLSPQYWELLFEHRDYLYLYKYLAPLMNKQVPYWKGHKEMFFDGRTKCFYNQRTKDLLFCVDEAGKAYRPAEGKLGSEKKIYLNDKTFTPIGDPKYGSFTTLRILRETILGSTGTVQRSTRDNKIY